jgi:MFS family permease
MNPPNVRRLLWVRALRAFGDGYVSLLLPIYLLALGFGPLQIGIVATGTLVGSGLLTLLVGLHAHRFRYRTLLLRATALMDVARHGSRVGAGHFRTRGSPRASLTEVNQVEGTAILT